MGGLIYLRECESPLQGKQGHQRVTVFKAKQIKALTEPKLCPPAPGAEEPTLLGGFEQSQKTSSSEHILSWKFGLLCPKDWSSNPHLIDVPPGQAVLWKVWFLTY